MHIQKLLAIVLLGLSLSAAADFTTITEAYEVKASDLRLPGAAGGTVTFKQCANCDAETVRVNSRTRYVVNGRDLELDEFKVRFGTISRPREETVTVLHHLESNTIAAIKVRF